MAKRRGSGEGSIYQRKHDGLWVGAITLEPLGGRRQRKQVYGKTRTEVRRKMIDVRSQIDAGVSVRDDRLTVADYLDRWLRVSVPGTVSDSTLADYYDNVHRHLNPALGKTPLRKLTIFDVDALWTSKREAGYKPNSIRYMRCVLRRALGQAEREGLVARNVAALSRPPRLDHPEAKSLTIEQAKILLDAAHGHRLEAAFVLMLSYGLRRGEVLGLSWTDLDNDNATLLLRQQVKWVRSIQPPREGHIELSELKTRQSRRTLYLTPIVLEALRSHRARQNEERLAAHVWRENSLIFTSTIGTPIDPNNFGKEFTRLCASAELGHWSPHAARHSAASIMLAQGVPLHVVSEVLGHSSIYITKDVYGHLFEGDKRAAAQSMADVLFAT